MPGNVILFIFSILIDNNSTIDSIYREQAERLEKSLGEELIRPGPRSFQVTGRGQRLYKECAAIFGSVSRLASVLEEAGEEISGTVRLAMASHVISPLLDETLEEFHQLHPHTCVSIDVFSSAGVIRSVQEKKAALGVCLVREQLPELDYRLMYTEHFGFFCGPRNENFSGC